MAKTKPKLTPGQRALKRLANDLLLKLTRLRNKAALVAGSPAAGRNLTALRNAAREVFYLIADLRQRRCLVCGCTDDDCSGCVEKTGRPCAWVRPDLCSACVEVTDR